MPHSALRFVVGSESAQISRMSANGNVDLHLMDDPNRTSVRRFYGREGSCLLEIVLKATKGSLSVGYAQSWWSDAVDMLAATPLPITPKHIDRIHELPPIHKDPFDRMLLAEAWQRIVYCSRRTARS